MTLFFRSEPGKVLGIDATAECVSVAQLHSQEDAEVATRVTYAHTTIEKLVELQGAPLIYSNNYRACRATLIAVLQMPSKAQRAILTNTVIAGPAFDLVIASEVIEHVADFSVFIDDCAKAVRPGGFLVVSTLNRTALAYASIPALNPKDPIRVLCLTPDRHHFRYALGIVVAEQVIGMAAPGTHTHSKFVTPAELTSTVEAAGLAVTASSGMYFSPFTQQWSLCESHDINYIVAAQKSEPDQRSI